MPTVKHIAYTMYPVKDMARARKFYEDVIGLKVTKDFNGAWVEYHLDNGCFAITNMTKSIEPSLNAGGSIAFEVDDVDTFVAELKTKNVTIKAGPFSTPVCRVAIIVDSEGNPFALHAKKNAS